MTTVELSPDAVLINSRRAAQLLSVSERTLWELTFKREPPLPHVRLGRRVLFRPESLAEFAKLREQTGGD